MDKKIDIEVGDVDRRTPGYKTDFQAEHRRKQLKGFAFGIIVFILVR
jgi:hypothetical protein